MAQQIAQLQAQLEEEKRESHKQALNSATLTGELNQMKIRIDEKDSQIAWLQGALSSKYHFGYVFLSVMLIYLFF